MSRAPLFSIVTVALNCADDAALTARSVLDQRFADYEYLVKDGGSTDGTVERLEGMGVRVVSRPDGGVYRAMNQALALCEGRYVVFMNAGDRFAGPAALEAAVEAIRRHGHPDMLYGDIRSFADHPMARPGGAEGAEGREIRYPDKLSRFYLFRKMVCHQAWFVRRDVYLALGGLDERYRLLADYAFLMRLSATKGARLAHIPAVTAIYQGGGASERQLAAVAAEHQAIRAWAFSPLERALYGGVYNAPVRSARDLVYRWLYRRLPAAARSRFNGS